ncbi:hypothetical protein SNE40_006165 [Patella caerulea]|uniref:Uncharacterized protein n=1 Tax=Patella caerulea TaxID=87958 RepID=A0AAN8K2R7_PATCE
MSVIAQSTSVNLSLWNTRSMDGKVGALCSSILSHHTDVFMITESWMTNEKVAFADANLASSISGFTSHHAPRANRRGGGLAHLVRSNLKVTKKSAARISRWKLWMTISKVVMNFCTSP